MKKEILIVLATALLGLGILAYTAAPRACDSAGTVAWWSVFYERPNSEQLPVRVHFWLAEKYACASF